MRWSPTARCTEPNLASSAPSPVSRAALSRPETSSRTPRCWATERAVGVGVDQRRAQTAAGEGRRERGRDGGAARGAGRAPDHDHPPGADGAGTASVRQVVGQVVDRDDRLVVVLEEVEHARQVALVGQGVDPDAGRPSTCRVRAPATGDRHDPDLVAVEQVDGGRVEAGRVEGDQRGVGLAGTARGEQVVDVDAALEHHEPGPSGDQLQDR